MTLVKTDFSEDEQHIAVLMGLLFRRISETFAAEDWEGLRQSHFRVLFSVPPEGITVTELADRVGMTKQGSGQFVTQLEHSGHLRTEADPADRRRRVVRRTAEGERVVRAVTRRNQRIEDEWADRVGERRYRTFRKVLEELVSE